MPTKLPPKAEAKPRPKPAAKSPLKSKLKPAGAAPKQSTTVMVRMDAASKATLAKAAALRHVSVSDYVRQVTLAQAGREVAAEGTGRIVLTPDEQLEFWNLLNRPVKLTAAQQRLGRLMRGEE